MHLAFFIIIKSGLLGLRLSNKTNVAAEKGKVWLSCFVDTHLVIRMYDFHILLD